MHSCWAIRRKAHEIKDYWHSHCHLVSNPGSLKQLRRASRLPVTNHWPVQVLALLPVYKCLPCHLPDHEDTRTSAARLLLASQTHIIDRRTWLTTTNLEPPSWPHTICFSRVMYWKRNVYHIPTAAWRSKIRIWWPQEKSCLASLLLSSRIATGHIYIKSSWGCPRIGLRRSAITFPSAVILASLP